jgi:hypothetical protein
MQLFQQTIDVVPGQPPMPPRDGQEYGSGCTVLRLTNQSSRENAYRVRVECDAPLWNPEWVTLQPLPPTHAPAGSASGKPDEFSADALHPWIKVYVSQNVARDLLVRVEVPQTPAARAGTYRIRLVIETSIGGPTGAPPPTTTLKAAVVIRPFHQWELTLIPSEKSVGFLRRQTEYEVCLVSKSNDWLYGELKLPQERDLVLEAPVGVVAVPPPPPQPDAQSERRVPLLARTRLHTLRGTRIDQRVSVSVKQLDAPSVAVIPDELSYRYMPTRGMAIPVGVRSHVLVKELPSVPARALEGRLFYQPLLPSTLSDLGNAMVRNVKGVIATVVALAAMAPVALLIYENLRFKSVELTPQSAAISDSDRKVKVHGSFLNGAVVEVRRPDKEEAVLAKLDLAESDNPRKQSGEVTLPAEINGVKLEKGIDVQMRAQRLGALPKFLAPFLPATEWSSSIRVGEPGLAVEHSVVDNIEVGTEYTAGSSVTIPGRLAQGAQMLMGATSIAARNGPDGIVFAIPKVAPKTYSLMIKDPTGEKVSAGTIKVVLDATPAPSASPAATPGSPGATPAAPVPATPEPATPTPVITLPATAPPVVRPPIVPAANPALLALLRGNYAEAIGESESAEPTALTQAVRAYAYVVRPHTNEADDKRAALAAAAESKRRARGKTDSAVATAAQVIYMAEYLAKPENVSDVRKNFEEARRADPDSILLYLAYARFQYNVEGSAENARGTLDRARKVYSKFARSPYGAPMKAAINRTYDEIDYPAGKIP